MESFEFGTTQDERLERLRGQLQGRPVGTRAAQRTQPSPGTNLLLGVMLHAAARLEAGLELTDLEARMVAPLQLLLPESEVHAFGRVYRDEHTARTTASVLPQVLTGRTLADGYAMEDLVKDLPSLREETLGQANVSVVDLNTSPQDGGTFDTEQFIVGQAAYGYGATLVTASAPPPQAREPGALASFVARVDMHAFLCEDESNEWSGSDEVYWATSSAGALSTRQELLTRVHGSVDQGNWYNFDPNTTLYNGRVDTSLVCNISCWEEDDGGEPWRNQLRDKLRIISAELMKFVDIMEIYGYLVPEYGDLLDYAQLTALAATIIAWLIDLFRNNDDLIQERTLVFTAAALRQLVTSGGGGSTGWVFNGGDAEGRHRLQLKWIGTPPPVDTPGDIKLISPANSQWGATTQLTGGVTDWGPSLAVYKDELHVASRGLNGGVHIGKMSGGAWQGYGFAPGLTSWTPPTLAAHSMRLWVASGGAKGEIYISSKNSSTSWIGPERLSGASSARVALADHGGKLQCAVRGYGSDAYIYIAERSGTWTGFQRVGSLQSFHAPALASLGGKLYLACAGFDGKTYLVSHNGISWSAATNLGGTTDSAPSLAVRNGVLSCAIRGLDSKIYLSSFNGTTWTGFTQAVPGAATMSEPALCGHTGDTLHIGYRTT
ncbi:hypothetical protein [Streptomyces sp. MJM1172]|uniref:hypothetical protein n=1 Tax=Streptomyces sp. MJM1172 TaxID=1703926 RepID=UPI00093DF59E|nr:hypothetical protein [Streptomyces sp. MJM1172]OKI49063.1 hypothetical protein AMK15_34475 [Streptomyces sp. MJM1172]